VTRGILTDFGQNTENVTTNDKWTDTTLLF